MGTFVKERFKFFIFNKIIKIKKNFVFTLSLWVIEHKLMRGQLSGGVVNTHASQLESHVFEATGWLWLFCLQIACSPNACVGFPQVVWVYSWFKGMQDSQINDCKLLVDIV